MEFSNFSIEHFLGMLIITGIISFIIIIIFDGLGKIKDQFYIRRRK